LALEGHGVVITRDSTLANAANLLPAFIEAVTKRYGGTRLGRQELNAELLEDTPGACGRAPCSKVQRSKR
jgi:phage terminase large subunit-like protein